MTTPSTPTTNLPHSASITGVADLRNLDDTSTKQPQQQLTVNHPNAATTTVGWPSHHNVTNTCDASAGARVLFATDEWFAVADHLLSPTEPHFDPNAYCLQGKVMDGWETRRRREAGHDWCIIQLAHRCQVVGLEVDTAYFTGNHVPSLSIQAADIRDWYGQSALVRALPGALERILHGGGVQGTGHDPTEVQAAHEACTAVAEWSEVLPRTPLAPGYDHSRLHTFSLCDNDTLLSSSSTSTSNIMATHVRVNYFPDGGVARLRVWGVAATERVVPQPRPPYVAIQTGPTCTVVAHTTTSSGGGDHDHPMVMPSQQVYEHMELSLSEQGGIGLACSNQHYGHPANLIQSTSGRDMGDGWETARHPNRPGILVKDLATNLVASDLSDWCILQLGRTAHRVTRIILDTKHFRGNYPESVQVEGCCYYDKNHRANDADHEIDHNVEFEPTDADSSSNLLWPTTVEWFPLVLRGRMAPDSEHVFDQHQIATRNRKVTHVRVTIFPDGGLSRVRVYGPTTLPEEEEEKKVL